MNGDGKVELISVSLNVGKEGKLWYLVHSMGTTYANETVPFTKYDCAELEVIDGSLYLLCEYADKDLATYRYRITLEGDKLIFTEEK